MPAESRTLPDTRILITAVAMNIGRRRYNPGAVNGRTTTNLAGAAARERREESLHHAALFEHIFDHGPGRFLLGIGVGHPEAHQEYRKPIDALNEYLDKLDEHGVPKDSRVVAALGPKVLKLSAERSAGAHPYLTTPEHTAEARKLIGPEAFLAPEHKAVLTTDAEKARAVGRKTLDVYLNLTNYLNSWKRTGFTDEDVAKPGSDRLVDAVVAYGTADAIAARLKEHITAGADHVPVQVLTGPDKLVAALTELAGPLGL